MNQLCKPLLAGLLLLSACNKDEVINETEEPDPAPSSELRVYEYRPAPGQFVGEIGASTMEEACAAAERRLKAGSYLSLGAWGGYVVVGVGRIANSGGYDFSIRGNSLDTSSEPGIVSVMADSNGDGLPNDTWYELRGSDYDRPETWRDYAVTYTKPAKAGDPAPWQDNRGNSGALNLKPVYPAWIGGESYTLHGSRLQPRNHDLSGNGTYWVNEPFDWGYADNYSPTDRLQQDGRNYFRISDAVDARGEAADLRYIDFIKVQTGVLAESGWLGELSTEICAIAPCQP